MKMIERATWRFHYATLISQLTTPYLWIPVVGFMVLFGYIVNLRELLSWGGLLIGLLIGLPLLYVALLVRMRTISDLHIAFREQRLLPFLVASSGAGLLFLVYIWLQTPPELAVLALVLVLNGLLFSFLALQWKLSVHAATVASSAVVLGTFVDERWFWLFWLVPLVIWARTVHGYHYWLAGSAAAVISSLLTYLVIHIGLGY